MAGSFNVYFGGVNANMFVLLDLSQRTGFGPEIYGQLSNALCATGRIDDLLVLEASQKGDVRYRVFGGDAREAAFCGNGALFTLGVLEQQSYTNLAACKRVQQKHKQNLTLETGAGLCSAVTGGDARSVSVGTVHNLDAHLTHVVYQACAHLGVRLEGLRVAGEPHLVISREFRRGGAGLDVIAPQLRALVPYDGGVNVTLVEDTDAPVSSVRSFERGVRRLTNACGSGSVAAASVLADRRTDRDTFTLTSPGGTHRVRLDRKDQQFWLSADRYEVEGRTLNPQAGAGPNARPSNCQLLPNTARRLYTQIFRMLGIERIEGLSCPARVRSMLAQSRPAIVVPPTLVTARTGAPSNALARMSKTRV